MSKYLTDLSTNNEIKFSFLNQKKTLHIPIEWNSKSYDQLWRFNLHYFDWCRELLEIKLKTGKWTKDSEFSRRFSSVKSSIIKTIIIFNI